ncbi:hypothetical protein ACFE04_029940 [Oxalis oulophora]
MSSLDDDSVPYTDSNIPLDYNNDHDDDVFVSQPSNESDGPILPDMEAEEGVVLREWRRENAMKLEEKEKREKELLSQIIDEAEGYKTEFYRKRETNCENNKSANREKEKVFVSTLEKFYAEADKDYWKTISELIPNEVPTIEKRGKKKDDEKKPSVVVVQGPKPGKPTELSRMRHILIKLKHNSPAHLKLSPPPPAAGPSTSGTTSVVISPEPVTAA